MRAHAWILALCVGCYHADSPSRAREPAGEETPALAAPDPTLPRVRRLSIREVCGAYSDLLGETIEPSEFLPEPLIMGFDNGSSVATVQTDQAARFEAVAWAAAERVTARREPKIFGRCDLDRGEHAACRDLILAELAPRAYRRPLTSSERDRLAGVYDLAADAERPDVAIQSVIATIFQSPAFLYREEIGTPRPSGELRLTGHEIATALSFFVAGTTPDEALLEAAARNELDAAPARRAHAERLLSTSRARRHWRTFVRQWLALEDIGATTKAPPYELGPGLRTAMNDELDRVIDDVLSEGTGSLDELFSTTRGYANDVLGAVYGLGDPALLTQRVALDPATRAGILTRAGWLAVHAGPDSSAPITRGVFVLGSLVCRPPPPAPPGITRVVPITEATKTTRQRFAAHTQNPQCQGCHASIDGVGFGFESFDAVGAFRATEGDEPVDGSGSIDLDGVTAHFSGPSELSRLLRASEDFRACFLRQVFRFAMGAPETESTLSAWRASASSFAITQRIDSLALTMVESDAFVTRRSQP